MSDNIDYSLSLSVPDCPPTLALNLITARPHTSTSPLPPVRCSSSACLARQSAAPLGNTEQQKLQLTSSYWLPPTCLAKRLPDFSCLSGSPG